ncbi:hypothetical protein KIN20_015666 [Parelaphostrongylus tenuis]|uniref:PNPLA domain-containing protein n=1 Tax=Parelaphostrongylus tenuis TaxID=148309 RepID=A0AAD5MXN7_PARTN|nr:hypothetical protein KIN20_015666 [Parelaphostrongylus tenuis]
MSMINCFPERMNLSFSGCGFLCIYHAGVAAAVKEYAPFLIRNKISGASAGAIVATCLVTNVCLSQATTTILKIVTQARSRSFGPLHPDFNLLDLVRDEMSTKLPPDAYKDCTGRLQISLTRWGDNKNVLVDEFTSNDDLLDAIMCSCFIPVYCGNTPPTFRGVPYVDGGFSDNQPSYDEYTVTISPFSGESDICPLDSDTAGLFGMTFSRTSIRFTTGNLFRLTACLMPPSGENCSRICQQGFDDALRFISRTIAPCIRCLSIHTRNYNKLLEVSTPLTESQFTCVKTGFSQLTKTAILRKKLLSECEFCSDSENIQSATASELFPVVLKKAFEEAYVTDDSYFNYLLSFRLFRYARTAITVGLLPLELFIIVAKKFASRLSVTVVPEWLTIKINALISFVLSEIEDQKKRYARFSCVLTPETFRAKAEVETVLNEDGRKEYTLIHESEKGKKVEVAPAPEEAMESMLDDTVNDDSFQHVIEYTKSHDTMYEFHYLDENNQLCSFEFFNVDDPSRRHDCHSHLRDSSAILEPNSIVEEEQEDEHLVELNHSDEDQVNTTNSVRCTSSDCNEDDQVDKEIAQAGLL